MPDYEVELLATFKATVIVEAEDEDDAKAEVEIMGESDITLGELETIEAVEVKLYDDSFLSISPEKRAEILARIQSTEMKE